ncbi:MAG: DUF5058 family protein [Clostridia bacterium]|nr:DUF5058 family protein [Clostridia bacterium]
MDFKSSPVLYLIAGAVILFVLAQSVFFLVKAWKRGKELGIDKKKLRDSVTSSAIFTIPSALSVLATVIALAPAIGLVVPWVRLSVLGNITYETVAATEAINAFGITTGISEAITDPEVFAGVAWVMTIGICFSLVILPFVAKPLHKKFLNAGKKKEETETAVIAEEKEETTDSKKKKRSFAGFMDHVTPALFIGLIGAFISNSILGAGKKDVDLDGAGILSVITLATAVISSVILEIITKKFKLTWLEPFIMPIGMIMGMVAAIVAYNVLPPEIAMLEWRG